MSAAVQQIKAAVDRLRSVGRAEGIEVDGPLGDWLAAQQLALLRLADMLQGQDDRVSDLLARIDASTSAQLGALHEAIVGANHVVKQGEFVLRQARTAQLGVEIERDHLITKMVKETLPLFAEKLKGALVIREEAWNAKIRDRRFALAAAIVISIFFTGYVFRWWQDSGPVSGFEQCEEHPVQFDGQLFCPAGALLSAPTVLKGSGGS